MCACLCISVFMVILLIYHPSISIDINPFIWAPLVAKIIVHIAISCHFRELWGITTLPFWFE